MPADEGKLYIGLISGTSLDGVDAGLFKFLDEHSLLVGTHHIPYASQLKARLTSVCQPGQNEIDLAGALDVEIGQLFARSAIELLEQCDLTPSDISAIGSHGQTIRHRPNQTFPFSLQIGDPNTIAYRTKITTVADFRRRDMCAGGQGAPLAPAFHRAVFYNPQQRRCVVNIGGIANLSILEAAPDDTLGYDSGPGNVLMDAWINKCLDRSYDKDGEWAASGQVNNQLLQRLLAHPYFEFPYPKSTGREDFNLPWLIQVLKTSPPICDADVQATLCELTAKTITDAVSIHKCDAVYLCGGGAHNGTLVKRISEKLPGLSVSSTEALGIKPDWVETGIFAWLAKQTLDGKFGSIATVTGANTNSILGAIYPA